MRLLGVNQEEIISGQVQIRAKPMLASYGCYGHIRGSFTDRRLRSRLSRSMRQRGPYVIQPEIDNAIVIDSSSGKKFAFIERNFFSNVAGMTRFLGGERTLMLTESKEAQRGRIHGNETTVTAEVY